MQTLGGREKTRKKKKKKRSKWKEIFKLIVERKRKKKRKTNSREKRSQETGSVLFSPFILIGVSCSAFFFFPLLLLLTIARSSSLSRISLWSTQLRKWPLFLSTKIFPPSLYNFSFLELLDFPENVCNWPERHGSNFKKKKMDSAVCVTTAAAKKRVW